MTSTLHAKPVVEVLRRLHAKADREDARAKRQVQLREAQLGHRLRPVQRYEIYGDAPLSITRQVGELYYLLAASRRPRATVEFGASHGISTIYLAAGLRDGGGGSLITTEILPGKAQMARENLRQAGLEDLVEIRVGDALQTLAGEPRQADLVVLDGRNDQYVPVLDMLAPRLPPGALVIADLGKDDPDLLAYQQHVRRSGSGFFSRELPLDMGVELSVRLGPKRANTASGVRQIAH
jgi:predicted O-methyltransferase YrrM